MIELNKADDGKLQDAWHYATLILDRPESTFDGDYHEFPEGIRGQMLAYERLLATIDSMTEDSATWELVKTEWWTPATFDQVVENSERAMEAIEAAAKRLGIDARTCQPLAVCKTCKEKYVKEDTGTFLCLACYSAAKDKFVASGNASEMVLKSKV
jgi:hypothetical protein